jgi:chaperonin GroEL
LENVDLGNEDQNIGLTIVAKALSYPASQIAENAGKESAVIANEILINDNVNYGYDAQEDKFVDMIEA